MSLSLDKKIKNIGTRFRIYPQPSFLKNSQSEVVVISIHPSKMQPGPADDRMYVIDAKNKRPYEDNLPPYTGSKNDPVKPGADGHFDKLELNSREFYCATMYATVRRVLDIWEDYFKSVIPWHFESTYKQLELIPLIEWDNAQSGYGFLEFGFGRKPNGSIDYNIPYCANFDVLAHELGHSIIYSKVGIPKTIMTETVDYGGMHESSGDLVALIALLHFDTIVNKLLDNTKGNLFTVNELDRIGELSENEQIRLAFNNLRMSDVGDEPHDRSEPLTGAIFDVLVEVFQKKLVENKLIDQKLADRSVNGINNSIDLASIQRDFSKSYLGKEKEFKLHLLEARDYVGYLLADTWSNLSADNLTYHDILKALFNSDRKINNGEYQKVIMECFAWREIGPSANSFLFRKHIKQFSKAFVANKSVNKKMIFQEDGTEPFVFKISIKINKAIEIKGITISGVAAEEDNFKIQDDKIICKMEVFVNILNFSIIIKAEGEPFAITTFNVTCDDSNVFSSDEEIEIKSTGRGGYSNPKVPLP